jgi:hypothetical protein
VIELEAGENPQLVAPMFEPALVRAVGNAELFEGPGHLFRTVGKHVQIDGGVAVGGSAEHWAHQPRCMHRQQGHCGQRRFAQQGKQVGMRLAAEQLQVLADSTLDLGISR